MTQLSLFFRALNNELLDTYQLKSLDGLVEARLEKIVIALRKEQDKRRSGGKKSEKKRKLYLTLNKYKQHQEGKNSSDVTGEELPGYHIDNFPTRKPYDRVIRCLGFRFNFSIFDRYRCVPAVMTSNILLPNAALLCQQVSSVSVFLIKSSACPPNSENAKGRLPAVTAWYEGKNTPGLFVLGTAAHSRDYRSSAGGFIHGFRYTGERPTVPHLVLVK